jgi:hypothetical protein
VVGPGSHFFEALYNNLWKNESRRSTIIYEVQFTTGHFSTLDRDLNKHIPSRSLPDYEAGDNPDVAKIKDALVTSASQSSMQLDGSTLVTVLDFRPFAIGGELFPESVLLVREEYKITYEELKKRGDSCFLTGQPGIG